MASARKARSARDAPTQMLEAAWTARSAVSTRTEAVLSPMEARWTPASAEGAVAPERHTRRSMALAQETGEQAVARPAAGAGGRRPSAPRGTQAGARQGTHRWFRKRKAARAEPDLYPSQQDAWSCGLFI